jgi:hypothetical protein
MPQTNAAPVVAPVTPKSPTVVASASNSNQAVCPKCNAPRDATTGNFCESCGFDFVTQTGGNAVATTANAGSPAAGTRMDLEVVVKDAAPLLFSLFELENLLGRKKSSLKQQAGITGDDAISGRQLMITRSTKGFTVRDLGSSNGTKLNKKSLTVGQEYPLVEGDVLDIGEFTKVTVKSIRS